MDGVGRQATGSAGWYDALRRRWGAALRGAHSEAHGPGQYVGQESFMSAREILALARRAGVASGTRVLDLCCGAGAAALYLVRETGCRITGVDLSLEGLRLARLAAESARFEPLSAFLVADARRIPLAGGFDVALLLETMLAIEDKGGLLREVQRIIKPGGRFALTLEEGCPLSPHERLSIPGGHDIWLTTDGEFLETLRSAGFRLRHRADHTVSHAAVAAGLAAAFSRHREAIAAELGAELCDDMAAAHERWSEWLTTCRVRKLAFVAEREG